MLDTVILEKNLSNGDRELRFVFKGNANYKGL